ncbi:MAG TPA: chloride channel protein [Candidatus Limnocylindrales bacterium]|nr:chloride channel protein [Candidatus Limnocylindrales bacterium]
MATDPRDRGPQTGDVARGEDAEHHLGLVNVAGAGGERSIGRPVTAERPMHPHVHVVIVAIIGALSVLAWLVVFTVVNRFLWENEFVVANPWLFPVICLPFSLLVGLLVKHRHAPTTLDESLMDSLAGDVTKIDWRALPVNILMAWASLFSGAVLGPEGGIGGIASKVAILYSEKVGIPVEHRSRLVFSTLASAYNGLIANPLFTGVLGTELIGDAQSRSRNLPANLIGGAIGYLVFFAVGSTGLNDYLGLSPAGSYHLLDVVLVVLFGLVGLVLALITGAMFRVSAAVFGRFAGREVERALVAGVVFSIVGMFAPILLFSGETQIKEVAADPMAYGAAVLVGMALVKLALLAVAFKSGFLGGPTFPAIFASVCVALAISRLAPGIPLEVIIGGIMGGFLLVLFKAPLMVILLTAVMLQASTELIALILLAVAVVLVVLPYVMAALARLQGARASGTGAAGHQQAGR